MSALLARSIFILSPLVTFVFVISFSIVKILDKFDTPDVNVGIFDIIAVIVVVLIITLDLLYPARSNESECLYSKQLVPDKDNIKCDKKTVRSNKFKNK